MGSSADSAGNRQELAGNYPAVRLIRNRSRAGTGIQRDAMSLRFGLFVIGDEILSGKRSDRHLAQVIELLRARGLSLAWAQYLPDERASLIEAFRRSLA